jgi:holin-like protein
MVHAGRIAQEWLPILAALVLSTAVTVVVTALAMRAAGGGGDGR